MIEIGDRIVIGRNDALEMIADSFGEDGTASWLDREVSPQTDTVVVWNGIEVCVFCSALVTVRNGRGESE